MALFGRAPRSGACRRSRALLATLAGVGAALNEHRRRLRAAADVQLLKSVAEIVFYCLVAERKGGGDLLVRLSIDHQREHALLLGGQRVESLHLLRDAGGYLRV